MSVRNSIVLGMGIVMLLPPAILLALPPCDGTVPESDPPPCKDPYSKCENRVLEEKCTNDGEYPAYEPKSCVNSGDSSKLCGNAQKDEVCYIECDCIWDDEDNVCFMDVINAFHYSRFKRNIPCERAEAP